NLVVDGHEPPGLRVATGRHSDAGKLPRFLLQSRQSRIVVELRLPQLLDVHGRSGDHAARISFYEIPRGAAGFDPVGDAIELIETDEVADRLSLCGGHLLQAAVLRLVDAERDQPRRRSFQPTRPAAATVHAVFLTTTGS